MNYFQNILDLKSFPVDSDHINASTFSDPPFKPDIFYSSLIHFMIISEIKNIEFPLDDKRWQYQ